ncbi:efflux RND transporter periplasmic adaptor subunit [Magnetovibrio sp.]|uniref:efflux RND transporter periplasmic adaptor subunit n=1 Tax=Magnetovibrio sp. TaxID=2024836 RepID=UPI002F925E39
MAQTKNKKKWMLLGATVVVACAGLAYWKLGLPASPSPAAATPTPAVAVGAMTLKTQTVALFKDLPSRTSAYKVADIRPQVTGIVTERLFEEGATVNKGQPLYQIDPAPYQAQYDSAFADLYRTQTNLKLVKAKADRYKKLLRTNAVSQQAYEDVVSALDQATADLAVAEAAVAAAQVNLNYTKVYAPISGRIGKSSITPGALVTANQAASLATVTQLDPIYVDLSLPSRDLMSLRTQFEGEQKPVVTLSDESGKTAYKHEGQLQFSEVTVDQTTGTVLMRALFPNPEQLLLPGMFVRAKLHLKPIEAVLVPQSAAVRGSDGKLKVWVIGTDNVVNPVPIEAHQTVANTWLIESGVDSGAVIVTEGFQKIRPGATVTPAFEKAE